MPTYSYIAKTLKGESKSGILEAKNEYDLARILRQQGCILIKADSEEKTLKKKKFNIVPLFFYRVSLIEKIMFTRNLRVMISAGISLPRTLVILSDQAKSKKLKNALLDLSEEITKGESFSKALERHPNIFSELFVNMIKTGEETGTLEGVLEILIGQMEKEHELKSGIKGAMIYPAVIVTAMAGIGILMLIMVVPKLAETFKELNIDLPLTTRLVVALGTFLANFWYLVIGGILLFLFLLRIVLKTTTGKLVFDKFLLKIPVISSIIKKSNSASTVRTLSSLIAGGVPIVRSLEITSGVLKNIYFKRAITAASEQVRKGVKLSEFLSRYQNIYPSLVVQMMAVGEETAHMSDTLQKLANFFEEEVSRTTKNLSVIIEPVLMIIIGAVVAFFAISMFQPIYGMIQGF